MAKYYPPTEKLCLVSDLGTARAAAVRAIQWCHDRQDECRCAGDGAVEPAESRSALGNTKNELREMGPGLICVNLARRATVHRSGRRPFLGGLRLGGPNVDSCPRRFAVACCQTVSPKGVPNWALRRKAFNSASVSA